MKTKFKNNPKNPANQPFNITGKKNLLKSNAWWQVGNRRNKKESKQ